MAPTIDGNPTPGGAGEQDQVLVVLEEIGADRRRLGEQLLNAPGGCSQDSGTCRQCQSACKNKPGWFKPGEAERAAEFMGLSLADFFKRYLLVDWWVDEPDVFVLSPAIKGGDPGKEFPRHPRGECVFFENGRCSIHPAKPYECRVYWCGGTGKKSHHQDVADAWREHQGQIAALLGREPVSGGGWSLFDDVGIGGLLDD